MPRKPYAKKNKYREQLPDHRYDSVLFAKFIRVMMMKHGKYELAARLAYQALNTAAAKHYGALEGAEKQAKEIELFYEVLQKVVPDVEVVAKRVGGAVYQVPSTIRPKRKLALAYQWIIKYARKRNEHSFSEKLSAEFVDILSGRGETMKKREEMHKNAASNRAYAMPVRKESEAT